MLQKIGMIFLISIVVYFGTAFVLIATQKPSKLPVPNNKSIDFLSLTTVDYSKMPALQQFTARDGAKLYYRYYKSEKNTNTIIVLLHGSGWHSMQFFSLANFISKEGLSDVLTPDLRGHGFSTDQRGDVNYIGQLEDDLADLIDIVKDTHPDADIIIGGHSSGGGLAIRFAGSRYGKKANAYILLAPFIKYNAPTTRMNSGGWAQPMSRRIAGISMLNNFGIDWLNSLKVIQFNMPQSVLESPLGDSVTNSYSYRLNVSFAPRRNYGSDLSALQQPFLLVAGQEDEAFIAMKYEPVISDFTKSGRYYILPDVGHIDLLINHDLERVLSEWLTSKN